MKAETLRKIYKDRKPDGHWFDTDTMRFFKSRIGAMRRVGSVILFVSSEQPPHGQRQYSIRRMTESGDIDTVGEFCSLTRGQTRAALERAVRAEQDVYVCKECGSVIDGIQNSDFAGRCQACVEKFEATLENRER
jgi:DNA-directed RNA polymerase subunit RPC12/RpoP